MAFLLFLCAFAGRARFHEHGGLFMLRECLHDYMVGAWPCASLTLGFSSDVMTSTLVLSAEEGTFMYDTPVLVTFSSSPAAGLHPSVRPAVRFSACISVKPAHVPHRRVRRHRVWTLHGADTGLVLA